MYIEATVGWVTLTPGAACFNREGVCVWYSTLCVSEVLLLFLLEGMPPSL